MSFSPRKSLSALVIAGLLAGAGVTTAAHAAPMVTAETTATTASADSYYTHEANVAAIDEFLKTQGLTRDGDVRYAPDTTRTVNTVWAFASDGRIALYYPSGTETVGMVTPTTGKTHSLAVGETKLVSGTPEAGAIYVKRHSLIGQAYLNAGANEAYGYATTNVIHDGNGGYKQRMELLNKWGAVDAGGEFHSTTALGSKVTVVEQGSILNVFHKYGQTSFFGYANDNQVFTYTSGGAWKQEFSKNVTIYDPSDSAVEATFTKGAIRAKYNALGSESKFGYPTTLEQSLTSGGVKQQLQKGNAWWSSATGARITTGGINGEYVKLGGADGRLGYPTSDEVKRSDGSVIQYFQKGNIVWQSGIPIKVTYTS